MLQFFWDIIAVLTASTCLHEEKPYYKESKVEEVRYETPKQNQDLFGIKGYILVLNILTNML